MVIWIDPVTRQRRSFDKRSGDLIYDLVGDSAVSNETVPVVCDWIDHTGSQSVNVHSQMINAGRSNELFGEDPGIDGENVPNLGIVGQNTQTTRRRQIRRRVDVKRGIMNNGRTNNQ